MTISSQDLLTLAGALSTGGGECEWRSSSSRAYYAAYHRALEVADACALHGGNAVRGVHETLAERYKAHSKKGMSIAYVLTDLKKTRTEADYHLSTVFPQSRATDFIPACEVLIAKVDDFLAAQSGSAAAGP
ncbi:hypothetical protein [Paraburkholderia tropica]|uniref:hypothetical protein n=1 Tax=Paraburkholderia tropica TaxID=92647 RepID=UPI00161EE7CC|nr:hypothetical protein [Paraburkholderia tropica]MBB6319281.1 uncharacterized protein (UPF0332 family) [Paraburkholderia tropica]